MLYSGLISRIILQHSNQNQDCLKSETKSLGFQKCLVAFLPFVAGFMISLFLLVYETCRPKQTPEYKIVNVNTLIAYHKCMAQDIKNEIELLDEEISCLEHYSTNFLSD